MISYLPYITAIVYVNDEYASNWIKDFVKKYPKSIEHIYRGIDSTEILLHDGSRIMLTQNVAMVRGYRADKIFVENGVEQEYIDYVLRPCLCRTKLIIDK